MRRIYILNGACFFLGCFLTAFPAYPWSSSIKGGTHYYIIEDAYEKLKTDNIDLNKFSDVETIRKFSDRELGPDAEGNPYEEYKYSNHYYNPSANGGVGEGNAPERAEYWYNALVDEIKASRGKGEDAAQAAAFLAHYVADAGVPYHVMGNEIAGPSIGSKDWSDDYQENVIVEGYEAVPTGDHPSWEARAQTYDVVGYWGISPEWEVCKSQDSPAACFVKEIAKYTESKLGEWMPVDSDKTEPLRHSMQDVYTVFRAAYEAGTVKEEDADYEILEEARSCARNYSSQGQEFDVKLIKVVNDKYASVEIIPLPAGSCEGAMVILEKIDGQWQGVEMGTFFPEWEEKVPELFEF